MTKLLFITFLLFAFYGSSWRTCQGQTLQVPAAPVYVQPAYAVPYYVPPVIYQPQIQWVPYQLDRTEVMQRDYRTPIRDLFFGRYRVQHYYRPQVQQ